MLKAYIIAMLLRGDGKPLIQFMGASRPFLVWHQLLSCAGNELENLMKNPSLNDLIGGIASVTLGDDEAKRRSAGRLGSPP